MKKKILLAFILCLLVTGCSEKQIDNEVPTTSTTITGEVTTTSTALITNENIETKEVEDKTITSVLTKTESNTSSTSTTQTTKNDKLSEEAKTTGASVTTITTLKKETATSSVSTTTTSKKTTTASTKKSTTTTTKKTLVSSTDKKELANDYSKYGTIYKVYNLSTYEVYSDGSTKTIDKGTKVEFDASGFNATTADMMDEAKSSATKYSSMIKEIVDYTNSYREEVSVGSLTLDSTLTNLATVRAIEMAWADKVEHTRPDGSLCFTVLSDGGLAPYGGENIASGYPTAASVSKGWKNSSGHYANMIDSDYTKIGVGVYKFRGQYYYVQLFQE